MKEVEIDKDILPFLSVTARSDVRCIAMQYFLGLTGTDEGKQFISKNDKYLSAIVSITNDAVPAIAKDAILALINLTAVETTSWKTLSLEDSKDLVENLIKSILNRENTHADETCALLSNMSRSERCSEKMVEIIIKHKEQIGFDKIIEAFCTVDFNPKAKLHYIGPFLSNLTQIKETRKYILDKERLVIQRLIPFTEYKESAVRRGGIVGTIRNCCFQTEYHEWLLSDTVDLLPRLLLPLAGPEEFDEDDMQKLPDDLQYLEPTKEREGDADIRKMLIEALYQLCATKTGRLFIKDKNTYVLMRELHNWEKDPSTKVAVDNFVHLLIADEPETEMENLSKVEIPENVEEKFKKMDEQTLKDIEEEIKELNTKETDQPEKE